MNLPAPFASFLRSRLKETVKTLYFPELWYAFEFDLNIKPHSAIAVLGASTPQFVEALCRSGQKPTLVDPSKELMAWAQLKLSPFNDQFRLDVQNFEALSFANEVLDCVVALHTLEVSPNPQKALQEIARVLKPGGKALIASFNRLSFWGVPQLLASMRGVLMTRGVRCLSKTELVKALKDQKDLRVLSVKRKGRYLPLSTRRLRIPFPWTGSYVVVLQKASSSRA